MTMRWSKINYTGSWLRCLWRGVDLFLSLLWRRVDSRIKSRIDIRLAYEVARGHYEMLMEDCGLREPPEGAPK